MHSTNRNQFRSLLNIQQNNFDHKILPYMYQENLISEIDGFAFSGVPSVTQIILYNNKLEKINKNMFSGLPNLVLLSLWNNQILTIELESFKVRMC